MNLKPMFLTIGIIAFLGIVTITFSYGQTALADKGGDPNNSDQAQANADERHDKKADRVDEKVFDDNPNNDNGARQAHFNTHDGKGVECSIC